MAPVFSPPRRLDGLSIPAGQKLKIDWTHPLTNGLVGCWVPGVSGGINLTGIGADLAFQSTNGFVTDQEGPALSGAGTGGGLSGLTPPDFYAGNQFSFYWRGYVNANSDTTHFPPIFTITDSGTWSGGFVFVGTRANSGGTTAASGILLQADPGGSYAQTPIGNWTAGKVQSVGGSYDFSTTNPTGYVNAVPFATGFASGKHAPSAGSIVGINYDLGGGPFQLNADCYVCFYWVRRLSDAEQLQIDQDPYCFLVPDEGEWPAISLPPPSIGGPAHFIGKFNQPNFNILRNLRQNVAADFSAPTTQTETNIHFVPQFFPPQFSILTALFNNVADDLTSAQVPETNTNFVANFRPVSYTIMPQLRQNTANDTSTFLTQPETNVHFVPRYTPVLFKLLPGLRQNIAADFSSVAQPETNTHFIAKFQQPVYNVLQSLRYNTANDFSSATSFETNTHFIAKFVGAQFNLLASLRQSPNTDLGIIPIAETNTHFIPRFGAVKFNLLGLLRQNPASDATNPPLASSTPTNFIARFSPYSYAILGLLRQNPATDFTNFVPPTMAQYRLLVDHYLATGYAVAGTVVTEGVQIPIGWIPTVAVDPLNLTAIQNYWNAGPTNIIEGERSRDFYPFAYWIKPTIYWSQVPGSNNTFILTGAGASLGAKQSG